MTVRLGCALALFVGLALVETFPLVLNLAARMPVGSGDPLLNTWILAWDVHALRSGNLRHFFDGNIFYPVSGALAFSEHLLGVLPVFAPAVLLTGNALIGYNVVFILSFALSGASMFALAYHWTRAFWPALVAGVVFGLAPFRLGQIGHLQILNFFWAPLALLFLDRFLHDRRWRSLAGFALCFWLQALSSVYLAYMVTLAVALYAGYHVIAVDRTLRRPPASIVAKALAFVACSVVVLLPPHLPYFAARRRWGFARTLDDVVSYSPDVLSYLSAPPLMNSLYVALFQPVAQGGEHEKWLFPGLVAPALAVLGSRGVVGELSAITQQRLRRALWLIAAVAFVVSLGPSLIAFGVRTGIPLPYRLLYELIPGFAAMRAPGRFALLAVLAVAPLAALGAMRCADVLRRRFPSGARFAPALSAAGLIVLLLWELGWKPLPIVQLTTGARTPPVYPWLAAERPGPIVELPFNPYYDFGYSYWSTLHWQPLVNGASGFTPPTYPAIKDGLAELPSRRSVDFARAVGISAIVLHHALLSPEQRSRWTEEETSRSGLRTIAVFGADRVYAVSPAARPPSVVAELAAPAVLPAARTTRLHLLLRNESGAPWGQSSPRPTWGAVIRWTDSRTGRVLDTTGSVQLPLALLHDEAIEAPLEVSSPAAAGTYTVEVAAPSAGLVVRPRVVEVRKTDVPSSADAPSLLAAGYALHSDTETLMVGASETAYVGITASNTGRALWLAGAPTDKGAVTLRWRWLKDGQEVKHLTGHMAVRYDVFPGQSYPFRVTVTAPAAAGTYRLELGLVSERVTSFADVGTDPVQLMVTVNQSATGGFAGRFQRLHLAEAAAPRVALAVDDQKPRGGDFMRLKVTATNGERPWHVDVYLALEGANGMLWLYDGERLVPSARASWGRLAGQLELQPGAKFLAEMDLSRAGIGPGKYTWHLLVTDAGSYRVIAEARHAFVLGP